MWWWWWIVRRLGWWLILCVAFTASLKLLLVAHLPPRATLPPPPTQTSSLSSQYRTPSHPTTQQPQQKVYLKGEVYAVRDSEYYQKNQSSRPGLTPLLTTFYAYLTVVRAQYASRSPHLATLTHRLKLDLTKRRVTDDPWDLARKWATPRSLVPHEAKGLGDILAALSTAPIIAADVGHQGTQLKLSLRLKGGQRAIFKPQWYGREDVLEGGVYGGWDRHNGEVAAFHLSRLLDLNTVPLTVGRRVSLKRHIIPVATRRLANTFSTKRGNGTCFYGVCHFCNKKTPVCDNGHTLEGSMTLWVTSRLPLINQVNPWKRSYNHGPKNTLVQWEKDATYCQRVVRVKPFSDLSSPRLLDLMDASVFDFLIQNGDRHHYVVVAGKPQSAIILLDNGKSFADPDVDHLDILTPLLQCCRLRQVTYERLVLLSGGGLSQALEELLTLDPIAPVLASSHLHALDRRLLHVLAALSACKDRLGGWHHVLF
ncbi:hypothetical protein Pmani_013814 [Petrolisthes manimaculis]|uniref:FAM20 C-terminal domain-containing protein n=1 Tax=Petrolisthes manimaculis TaxID=1843537 RepID=A0AAE1UBT5_9EUCA|nr:hypothetical protein Pmani_013814 [Petrolisthes manimaculis]